jgi:phosphonate transport system substrate-binding protein
LKEITFVGTHNAVVEAVLQGRVDAGACYDDARTRFLETEPDIMEKTRVVAYTAPIPSDTFSLREDCTGPFYDRLVNALVQLGSEGKDSVLFKIYQIESLVPAVDSDYDLVRQMVQTLNLDLQSEVDKKQ